MTQTPSYWFPAKQYGWGWGFPNCWQGWVTLGIYACCMVGGTFLFDPKANPIAYLSLVSVASVALVVVCYLKGEPPSWRWGQK
jgi:hypothetical protein